MFYSCLAHLFIQRKIDETEFFAKYFHQNYLQMRFHFNWKEQKFNLRSTGWTIEHTFVILNNSTINITMEYFGKLNAISSFENTQREFENKHCTLIIRVISIEEFRRRKSDWISMWKTIISKENIWCGNKNTLFLIPFWSWTNISSEERRDFYHNSSTTFSDFWISERMKWTTNQFKQVFFSSSCFGYFSTSILSQIIWDIIRLENKPNFSRHCHICSKMAEF